MVARLDSEMVAMKVDRLEILMAERSVVETVVLMVENSVYVLEVDSVRKLVA